MAVNERRAPLAQFESAGSPAGSAALQWALLLLVVAVHGALWWRAVYWYPLLPERIPTHFDAAGRSDGWATTSAGSWFLLPGIGAVLLLLFGALAWFVGCLPRARRRCATCRRRRCSLRCRHRRGLQ